MIFRESDSNKRTLVTLRNSFLMLKSISVGLFLCLLNINCYFVGILGLKKDRKEGRNTLFKSIS